VNWLSFAMAQPGQQSSGNPLSMFLPIFGMLIIFYFLLIRPQQKRQKETRKMIDSLKKGDRVITASGLYGTIQDVKENMLVLKIADNVKVEMLKSSVTGTVEKGPES